MAVSFFLNMEKLCLTIAEEHINKMTDSNVYEDNPAFIENDKLLNNIKNGFIAITQMNCYIESFLNTIMNACIGYGDGSSLKSSIKDKLKIIFLHYGKEVNDIKSKNYWLSYIKTTKIRNEMIHFKKNYVGDGVSMPHFELNDEDLTKFFTQKNLKEALHAHIQLANEITKQLDLKINNDINIIECDAVDGLVTYVYDEKQDINNVIN